MSGWTGTLWRHLNEGLKDSPICLVLYPSAGALDDTIETVRLVGPDRWTLVRSDDVEDAFSRPEEPLLLIPDDEAAAVRTLDGRREALLERTAPVILFLLKDGSGQRELQAAPGLASWLQGRQFDPAPAEIDVARERDGFEKIVGRSPEVWLAAWRRGEIADTLANNFRYQRAMLLEGD